MFRSCLTKSSLLETGTAMIRSLAVIVSIAAASPTAAQELQTTFVLEHEAEVTDAAVTLEGEKAVVLAARVRKTLAEGHRLHDLIVDALHRRTAIKERIAKFEQPWTSLPWADSIAALGLLADKKDAGYVALAEKAYASARTGDVPMNWRSDMMRAATAAWYQMNLQNLDTEKAVVRLRGYVARGGLDGDKPSGPATGAYRRLWEVLVGERNWRPAEKLLVNPNPRLRRFALATLAFPGATPDSLARVLEGLLDDNQMVRRAIERSLFINPTADDRWVLPLTRFLDRSDLGTALRATVGRALAVRGRRAIRRPNGTWAAVRVDEKRVRPLSEISKMEAARAFREIRKVLARQDIPDTIYVGLGGDPSRPARSEYASYFSTLVREQGWTPEAQALLVDSSADVRKWALRAVDGSKAPDAVQDRFVEAIGDADPQIRAWVQIRLARDETQWTDALKRFVSRDDISREDRAAAGPALEVRGLMVTRQGAAWLVTPATDLLRRSP